MLFARNSSATIEELIIEAIGTRANSGAILFEKIRKILPKTSKATFYRSLHSLLKQEVITKYGKMYGINRHWLHQLYRFSKPQIEFGKNSKLSILSFEDGDTITYKFKTPNLMGIYLLGASL